MKKLIALVLAVMLLLAALPFSALAEYQERVYISRTGKGTMNLRAGPGYEYIVLGYVKHNRKVTVTDEVSGDWVKIQYGKKTGWIKSMYVDGTTKELGEGYKAIDFATNVYKKADEGSSVRGYLTTSDTVLVNYTENDMASVSVTGSKLSGWIPIDAIGETVDLKPETPPSYSDTVYRTTASTLHLRAGAGTDYAIIGKLKRGTGVTILDSAGNWRRVKTYNGQIGWVSANYLTKQATAKVTASVLNVRKGPGTNTSILGGFKRGTRVTVQYTSGNWAYVSTKKLTGYVSLNYLRF